MKAPVTAQHGTRSPLAADAVAGIFDPALRAVVADHWEHMMRWLPTWATTLGDHRFDDQLAPRDAASLAAMDAEQADLLARALPIDSAQLSATDAVTCMLLQGRLEAEGFLHEHTALTPSNIANEVDRYIGWPGQALAYKIGQLEIVRLRRMAEQQLGARFDLKAFHATVLGAGAVTLPVLGERVNAWLELERSV